MKEQYNGSVNPLGIIVEGGGSSQGPCNRGLRLQQAKLYLETHRSSMIYQAEQIHTTEEILCNAGGMFHNLNGRAGPVRPARQYEVFAGCDSRFVNCEALLMNYVPSQLDQNRLSSQKSFSQGYK